MTELVRVRGLFRKGIRVGSRTISNTVTTVVDVDDAATRRDLAHHSAIGQYIVVGDATVAVATGVVVTNGTTNTYSVSAGTLLRDDGTTVTVSAVSNQATTASNATNPRLDIVSVSPAGAITYLADTAAVSPVLPVPAGATDIIIARLAVPAGTTTTPVITDVAPRLA